MHVIVVRRDLRRYQHLHPAQGADGAWTVAADPPRGRRLPRVRRLQLDGSQHTLGVDLFVPGDFAPRDLPAAVEHGHGRRLRGRAARAPRRGRLLRAPRRQARHRPRALPRRARPPRRAARGRPRLRARPPRARAPARDRLPPRGQRAGDLPAVPPVPPRAAASTPPPSRRVVSHERRSCREHLDVPITGMTCASCAARIEKRLNRLDGVQASVNYATERASVAYEPAKRTPSELVATIERAGYTAHAPAARARHAAGRAPARHAPARAADRLGRAVAAAARARDDPRAAVRQLAVAVAAARDAGARLWCGCPFHRAAWTNLRHGTATMDTLISIGTIAAWTWSVVSLFFLGAGDPGMRHELSLVPERGGPAGDVYFEIVGVVITFLLAGRTFEARAKRRAGDALRALIALGAKDAAVLGARRRRAARAGRAAAHRRPLRRAAGREDRDRRRGGRGLLGRRPLAADGRERARSRSGRATR